MPGVRLEGLPAVDVSAVDTFETGAGTFDGVDPNCGAATLDDKNGDIVSIVDANTLAVRNSLQNKLLDTRSADFSDRAAKGKLCGYISGEWIAEETLATSLSQRLLHITADLNEIEAAASAQTPTLDSSSSDLLNRVRQIRSGLSSVLKSFLTVSASSDSGSVHKTIQNGATVDPSVLRLFHRPGLDSEKELSKLFDLEARLSCLEGVLGNADMAAQPLLSQLAAVESRVALLENSSKLDEIESRLGSIVTRLQNARSAQQTLSPILADCDKLENLHSELFGGPSPNVTSADVENWHIVVNDVVSRLSFLSHLHQRSLNIVDSLSEIEVVQNRLDSQIGTATQLLEKLSKSLATSNETLASMASSANK